MQTRDAVVPKEERQIPLTDAQKELWLLAQLGTQASVAYNVCYAIELRGALDLAALRRALQAALDRHEALRARVDAEGEMLVVVDGLALPLAEEDLSQLGEQARHERLRREGSGEFDLTAAPLLRCTLFRTGAEEHVLLLVSHHLVVDGGSMQALFRDLGALYAAFHEGREPRLPAPARYVEHVERLEQVRRTPAWVAAEAYWLARFERPAPVLDLPADRLRPGVKTYAGALESVTIEAELVQALEAASAEHGCTLFMTLFAGFAVLARRLSGQPDVVLGINVSGRSGKESRDAIAYLTRLLPVWIRPRDDSSAAEFLQEVRDTLIEALAHREYTLGDLIRKLNPARPPGRSPLVDVVFNFDRAERLQFTGLEARLVPVPLTAAKYDIDFNVVETRTGLRCDVEYSTELFEAHTIRRFVQLWRNLLRGLAAEPHARLRDLPWLDEEERRRVLADWNGTAREEPPQGLTELLEAQARRTPQATAAAYEGVQLSYAELDSRANRLARHLLSAGVGRETKVGVYLERGLDWVVAILAVWKAGGVYVPLDVAYPKERLAFMLDDAAVQVLLTEEAVGADLPPHAAHTIRLDSDWEAIEAHSAESPGIHNQPGDLAYLMYTSGSTGRPKGAMLEHRGMLNHLWAKVDDLGLSERDVVAQNAPASFDISVWQVFAVMLAGGSIQIIGEDIARDATRMLGEAQRLGVTVFQTVPTLLGLMVEQQEQRGARRLDLRAMRFMISHAEPLPVGLCRQWKALYPDVALLNAYGPTECSDDMTHLLVELPLVGLKYAPLGKRIRNMTLYVLDEAMRPVPIGVAGELHVGGIGVGRGYLARPQLTAEKFVPDPFTERPGARLYKTGDQVRLRADGTCDFIGRLDHQVKLRGLRVELPEIEAALGQHPAVLHAAAVVREDRPGDRRLVGYVVGKPRAAVDGAELREYLLERLPDFMVPGAIVVLERMPLTANEKIDRGALPAPEQARVVAQQEYRAPRTPVEETLAQIWSEVLHVERVGIDDNFFALGGHSLLATQVAARMRAAFQVALPLRRVFEARTLAVLAQAVEEQRHAGAADQPLAPIERVPRDQPLLLSHAQERLWFLQQFETDKALYNMLSVLRVEGELHVPTLERAMGEVVRRHEVLRSRFVEENGRVVQMAAPPAPVELPVVDLQGHSPDGRRREIERLIEREVRQPFDLSAGPLLRGLLLRVGPREHLALLGMHHIVGDGWSLEVFLNELARVYDAFVADRPVALAELPFQYADWAAWQRRWLQGEVLQRQLAYWRTKLQALPQAIDLPTVGPRPASPSHRGRQHTFKLSRQLSDALRALSGGQGVTLFMTLLAGFQALLARCSGQTDIVVGGPSSGRSRGEAEGLIGFFVNALVLRTDLSGRISFLDLLERVRDVVLGAQTHQDVPFERLVEELQPQRDISRTPLFQVMFDLQRPMKLDSTSLVLSEVAFEFPMEKFDLSLRMVEVGDGLDGILMYQTDLFDEHTIAAMVSQFEVLLTEVAASPERPLAELELLTPGQKRLLVSEWNATQRAYPGERGVHELFESRAAEQPDAPALVHGSTRLTYGELDRRANRLAHYLHSRGVGPEARVGLCFERGVDLVVGLLGILKAGGAYVPLDPSYPAERLMYMVEDAGVSLVIAEDAFHGRFWESSAEAVSLESIEGELARMSPQKPPCAGAGDALAYVMYTSGSTGTPKGIMVPHRAISRLVVNTDYVGLDTTDRVAQVSNTSFDAATFEVWGALANGATLIVIDKEIALSPVELGRHLSRERVTAMFLTTALFNQAARDAPGSFKGLRHLLFGGEAVDPRRVREVLASDGPERLLHVYGPTETTTFATWFHVRQVEPRGHTIPIGHPIANTCVYVLDRNLRLVPPGLPGEIYIGGPGVARGYWGRPGLTAEHFLPDPFAGGGERIYRTGDKARQRADGALEFLGRLDGQVKVRGYRIEVGEIEAALKQDDAVKDAVVVVREEGGEKRLVGYVVAKPGAELTAGGLREASKNRLPEYMLPADLVVLPELPLNENGKVDRDALPAPAREDHDVQEYVAPRSELEATLCRIWAETLQLDRVGTADNFFDLGGHSLLATRLVSRVRNDLGVELGLRVLFEWPTVAGFTERVEEELAKGPAPSAPVVTVERTGDLPLSHAQSRLWFIHQLQPHSVAYNAPLPLRLRGDLDRARLERCLTEIVRRHEVLRTTFPARAGQPTQAIHPPQRVDLPLVDLSALPERPRLALARSLRQQDAERLFELARGPLFRATLLRLAAREHELLLAMHHIVTDGWSGPILVQELFALWNAYSAGLPSPLPEPALQYADYAIWQQKWLQAEVLDKQLPYWRERLRDVTPLDLPTDRPRRPVAGHPGAELNFLLGPEQSARLGEFVQRDGVTPFMALLAAFQWLLSRYAMQNDVAVGTAIAHRNRKEIENLIGFFVNALVLRTDVSGSPSFRELVQRVREVTTGAYTHQDLPFEKLVEELNPERDMRRAPLSQARLTFDEDVPAFPAAAGLTVEEIYLELPETKFDLTMAMQRAADGTIKGCLIYAADLFERRTMERLVEQYRGLLAAALADPDLPLSEIPLLGEQERRQVVVEWNRTAVAGAPERCVHELFEEHARRAPDAPAVVYEGRRLSYAELDRKANQLAHLLRAAGAGPEVRVGICMTRGLELAVALMGVLKAGGAYVPIDPASPSERTARLLEGAQVPVLLTLEPLRAHLPSLWIQTVCLDSQWEEIEAQSTEAPLSEVRPDNLAYLIHTSGSTGAPKAVGIEHRQLVNYVAAVSREMGCAPGWKHAWVSSLAADLGNTVLYAALCGGGELHLISEDCARDGRRLGAYFRDEAIDCTKITPSHLAGLTPTRDLLPARLLVLGGEPSEQRWIQELQALRPECRVMNHYGPTECTVGAVACRLEDVAASGSDNVPLGRPLGNLTAYVLDEAMRPLPVGLAGELYVGGAGVGRGYLDAAALTAPRFLPDPFGDRPGARLYRTGDKARWRPDGVLEFLGRVDHQVKVRGFRVELGEIESVLKQHPEVGQAAVLLRNDHSGKKQLVAYASRRAGETKEAPLALHTLPNGLTIAHHNRDETEGLYHAIFESRHYLQCGMELPEDACVFDVGSNIGMFTLFAGERCPRGRVFAFEPIDALARIVKHNARLCAAEVEVFAHGLADAERTADFVYYPEYGSQSGVKAYAASELEKSFETRTLTARLRRLSDVMREQGVEFIDYLKIDVQRSELDVLAGIDPADWEKIARISVFVIRHKTGEQTQARVREVVQILEQRGFTVAALQDGQLKGGDWSIFARHPEVLARRAAAAGTAARGRRLDGAATAVSVDLRNYLKERLPEYMVPNVVLVLPRFPLTPSGKLDRRALPAPEESAAAVHSFAPPRTELEELLCGIWAEVLGVSQVGIHDDFFALGGHSLLATQVVSRIESALGVEIPLAVMFTASTVAALAADVERARAESPDAGAAPPVPLVPVDRDAFMQP